MKAISHPFTEVPANPAFLRLLECKHALMLQGPLGPFFDRLARWLGECGVDVKRVVFQRGDELDCRALAPICYRGSLAEWADYFTSLLDKLNTDVIILFGQSRAYHAQAIQLARARGVSVVVLEEGYFRPGYVTIELDGVNGYSSTLERFRWNPASGTNGFELKRPENSKMQFQKMAYFAARHYLFMRLGRARFPRYQHHKQDSITYYVKYWLRSWLRKIENYHIDHWVARKLDARGYFLVPMQHDGDAQITHHSPYSQNTEFIIEVMRSFARHAPEDAHLVFRQHPFSRGGAGHAPLIRSLARELLISDRVVHLVEGHTPTLVQHARGVVVINSTVGLQSLVHRRPLMVLGDALYKQPGLSFTGSLDEFWRGPSPLNESVVSEFLTQIRELTQLPCNVYGLAGEPLHWRMY